MNTTEIDELLEKFYEGTSTAAEEIQLMNFFENGDYPTTYAAEADQFRFYREEKSIELPDPDFLEKLEEKLSDVPVIRIDAYRNRLFSLAGIAATLLLLIGLFLTIRQEVRRNAEPELIRDPQVAYVEAQKALLLLSASLNTGISQAQHFKHFEEGIASVQHFSDFSKYQTININPNN